MADFLNAIYFGLVDALNPCKLSALGFFLLAGSLLCNGVGRTVRFFVLFIVAYVSSVFLSRFGTFDGAILNDLYGYRFLVITFYMTTGGIFIVFGGWLLYVWRRSLEGDWNLPFWGVFRIDPFVCGTIGLVLGALAGSAATYWPRSKGMLVIALDAYLPGKLLWGTAMVTVHEVVSFWPLLLIFLVYYFLSRDAKAGKFLVARKSLLYIVLAAMYVALGASLLWLFFPKTV